jgi:hypothetical protein
VTFGTLGSLNSIFNNKNGISGFLKPPKKLFDQNIKGWPKKSCANLGFLTFIQKYFLLKTS